jgi:2-octaprenyl-6-methoxyphenol hydroxylase
MTPIVKDVAIVGGGLAGGLCALALADAGLEIAVIDAQDPKVMRAAAFDGRTTALSYAAARMFRRLGLWRAIEPDAQPILDILVTDGRAKSRFSDGFVSDFRLHFDSRELDGEPLGYIVENRILRDAVFDRIAAVEEIVLTAPAKVGRVRFGKGPAIVELGDGRMVEAPLVVAADGKNSSLRADAGIKVSEWRYAQTGIVATVAHERPHKGVAHELFLPSGPFAILPMTENRSSLVWTEKASAAPAYLALDEAKFLKAIRDRFGEHLGEVSLAGPRWSYPLSFHFSHAFIAPRMALLGDAARAVHPIAGQGFNLGVKDAAALADVVGEARQLGLDLGSESVLEGYQRWRRFDSASLALGMDAMVKLFSNDIAPLRFVRSAGMAAVGQIPPLRKFFMRQAGADLGALPPLMAPER